MKSTNEMLKSFSKLLEMRSKSKMSENEKPTFSSITNDRRRKRREAARNGNFNFELLSSSKVKLKLIRAWPCAFRGEFSGDWERDCSELIFWMTSFCLAFLSSMDTILGLFCPSDPFFESAFLSSAFSAIRYPPNWI